MKERTTKKSKKGQNSPQAAFRLEESMFLRLQRIVGASRRSRTSVIEECLERALPEIERRYAKEAA